VAVTNGQRGTRRNVPALQRLDPWQQGRTAAPGRTGRPGGAEGDALLKP